MELTTLTDTEAVLHDGTRVLRHDGLEPDTDYEFEGISMRTMSAPPGELLSVFATVNDVHFGEEACGIIDGNDSFAIRVRPGEAPYPETMNAGAVAEISALDPPLVLVKGDLSSAGTDSECERFSSVYESAFGDRLRFIRGNHESYHYNLFGAVPVQVEDLPGVRVVLVDTSRDGYPNGTLSDEQLDAISDAASETTLPVLVFGHHHVFFAGTDTRDDSFFGILPDRSDRLVATVARHANIRAYSAGHTHRNRVVRFDETGSVPFAEVGSVKDYPGGWAEIRVYEGGIRAVFHRISTPQALDWTERTAEMFNGLYRGYAFGRIDERCYDIPLG